MIDAQQVYTMLGNRSLWQTVTECHKLLDEPWIPHLVCGGVAVCLHGYQRNTVDLDVIIRPDDAQTVRRRLEKVGLTWDAGHNEFITKSGIAVRFHFSGDRAAPGQPVRFPDPGKLANLDLIDGLPVLRLSRLIEVKLACGTGNMRRTHKDFADVVELIAIHKLDSSFARYLHKSVRKTFRELVKNARACD